MTYCHGLTKAQLLDDASNIVGVGRDRARALRLVTLAVPAQVNRHDPVPPRKMLGLRREERAIAAPSVHEDKGGLAGTAILKGQLGPLMNDCRHDLASRFPRAQRPWYCDRCCR